MKYKTPLHLRRLFRKKRKIVGIYRRIETVDDNGVVEYTYPEFSTNVFAVVYSTSGFREVWYEIGFERDIDYILTVEADVTVNARDLIDIGGGLKVVVEEKIPRGSGHTVQYWELLCNRVEG